MQKTIVQAPMIYHDVERRFMIWFVQEVPGESPFAVDTKTLDVTAALLSQYRFRFVLSWPELVEKINVFENGWDDKVVEFLKLFVVERFFPFGTAEFNESTAWLTGLRDDGDEWPAFEIEVRRGNITVGVGTVPSDIYDKLAQGQEERFGKNPGAGEWQIVNKATILRSGDTLPPGRL